MRVVAKKRWRRGGYARRALEKGTRIRKIRIGGHSRLATERRRKSTSRGQSLRKRKANQDCRARSSSSSPPDQPDQKIPDAFQSAAALIDKISYVAARSEPRSARGRRPFSMSAAAARP